MIIDTNGKIETVYKVVIEKNYQHPITKVWEAITNSEHVSKWMEYRADINLKVGGHFHIEFGGGDDLNGVITKIVTNEKLFYAWNDSIVMWELDGDATKTSITFTHNGLSHEKAIELGSGWEAFFDYLDPFLSNKSFPKNRHQELFQIYQKMI